MSLNALKYQVSKSVNSDACSRPTAHLSRVEVCEEPVERGLVEVEARVLLQPADELAEVDLSQGSLPLLAEHVPHTVEHWHGTHATHEPPLAIP
jgi:hypothetical protein